MANSGSFSGGANPRQGAKSAIPSDQLPLLRDFLSMSPQFREIFGDLLELRVVIDANIVYGELTWRLGKRRNPAARSALHEAIDSGTIVAFAPPVLEEEIRQHIGEIAERAKVPVSRALQEWQQFKLLLHFYDPEPLTQAGADPVDPEDLPYKLVCEQLGAQAVYSRDRHLQDMGAPVIRLQLDLTVRDYARASSVRLTISVGATFSVIIGFGALVGLFQACVQILKQLPTPVKLILLVGALVVVVHPKLRAKVADFFRSFSSQLDGLKPALRDALGDLLTQATIANATAKNAYAEIQSILPPTRKVSAVVRARAICLLNKEPLSLQEMEVRMRKEGYVSRSQNFTAYLRRVLRKDKRFVEVSPGRWTVRAERLAGSD